MTPLERFAKSVDTLFEKLGMEAGFIPAIGSGIVITVVPKRPDAIIGLGDTGVQTEVTLFDLRASEVEEPKAGDVIEYDGTVYRIIGEPRRDVHRLVWTVEAVQA